MLSEVFERDLPALDLEVFLVFLEVFIRLDFLARTVLREALRIDLRVVFDLTFVFLALAFVFLAVFLDLDLDFLLWALAFLAFAFLGLLRLFIRGCFM